MEQLKELELTFIEEHKASRLLLKENMTKSSLILLSKSLFVILDYMLYKKYKRLPKNHTERFRILEMKEPKMYSKVDKVWSKYTDSYSKPADKESIEMFDEIIKEVSRDEAISDEIKEIVR